MSERAWIGLGSNLGDPATRIRSALDELGAIRQTRLLHHSALYRSAPWGGVEQPDFVNAVAELETGLAPRALLDELLRIERLHGRVRDGRRWGPRTLDLDLLVHGMRRLREEGLVVPHPQLVHRAFVLVPLMELAPDLAIPGLGRVADLLLKVDAGQCLRLTEP